MWYDGAMNYIAHLYLADDHPLSLLGNFMGDFVKGKLEINYPDPVLEGIRLHRRIDAYTDRHVLVKACRGLIQKRLSRLSGVLVDIFYDHFLVKNWQHYHSEPFTQCVKQWYRDLRADPPFPLPDKLNFVLHTMVAQDWLGQYGHLDGVEDILQRVSRRISFPNELAHGMQCLHENYDRFDENFNAFFPQLIEYVQNHGEKE